MALASPTMCGSSIGHQLAICIVLLSIVLLSTAAHAVPRPTVAAMPTQQQLLFNELLNNGLGNEDNNYYGQQLMYRQQQQQQQQQREPKQIPSFNYFGNKWPSLRDLVLTADYDDTDSIIPMEHNELERAQLGSRLLARLHRLGDNGAVFGTAGETDEEQLRSNMLDELTAMPTKKQSEGVVMGPNSKQHNIKKNVQFRKQYMSPCHFKICNMGRKRNTASYVPY